MSKSRPFFAIEAPSTRSKLASYESRQKVHWRQSKRRMSRKRPATEPPDAPDPAEELPDMLVGILSDMSASQRMLTMHSHGLNECVRLVNHLHTVLVQAHQHTTERIDMTISTDPAFRALRSDPCQLRNAH